jgi:hypothetical protein
LLPWCDLVRLALLCASLSAPVSALFLSDATFWLLGASPEIEPGCVPAAAPGVAACVVVANIKFELCGRQR